MTHEEELARIHAPVLSIGRYIFETRRLPRVGQSWKVDAEVVVPGGSQGTAPSLLEFSFDVVIDSRLLTTANALARSMQSTGVPTWLRSVGSIAIGIKGSAPQTFRTNIDDLRMLVKRLDHMFDEGRSKPDEKWVLAYLSLYWAPLLPAKKSKDYYLGEVHGLRIALDFFDTRYPKLSDGDERILMGIVFIALAGVGAERYLDHTPRLGNDRFAEISSTIPSSICSHRPMPFEIDTEEVASLAEIDRTDSDSEGEDSIATRSEFEKAVGYYIGPDQSPDFYDGLLHGLYLSLQVVMVFHDTILSNPDSTMQIWEETLLRFCGIAARHRLSCS